MAKICKDEVNRLHLDLFFAPAILLIVARGLNVVLGSHSPTRANSTSHDSCGRRVFVCIGSSIRTPVPAPVALQGTVEYGSTVCLLAHEACTVIALIKQWRSKEFTCGSKSASENSILG
jgi:hypothetical protein